ACPSGRAAVPHDLRAAPARGGIRGGRRQDAGGRGRRRVARGAGGGGTAARPDGHEAHIRSRGRPPDGPRRPGRARPPLAAARRGRPRLAGAGPGGDRGPGRVPDARPRAPVVHEHAHARSRLHVHAGELSRGARRSRVPGHGGGDARVPGDVGQPADGGWARHCDPARRRAAPPRAIHAGRPRRGGQRLDHPRRARRRALADPPHREPLGDRELLALAPRSGPVAARVFGSSRPGLAHRRQRVARVRLQHDPSLRGPAADPARAARGGRPRRARGLGPLPRRAAAALEARAGPEPRPRDHPDPQHLRPHPAPDRRRPRAAHRGRLALHVPRGLREHGGGTRGRRGRDPARPEPGPRLRRGAAHPARGQGGMSAGRRRWPYTIALAAVAIAFVLPMLWLFSVSLKTKAGVYGFPPQWVPDDASLDNYAFVLARTEVPWYLLNSFKVALAATAATLLLGVPAAFVLSREDVRGRASLLTALLALQMVSPIVLLVPIYGLIGGLGLLDSHAGLVVVYAAVQLPFTIVVLKNFFDALPTSLLEAARLDGASRPRVLWRVALPLLGPGVGATATFNLAWYWAEFALALVLLDSQGHFTIPVGLFSFQSGYETEWQLVAAASFIGLVPVIATFVLLQRFFVSGLTAGAVKG